MANERQTLSLDPSLKARLAASASASGEALSPHACKLIEAGLSSAQLTEQRDRRVCQLADELARTKAKLSQTSSNGQEIAKALEALKTRAEDSEYVARSALRDAAEAERERDRYLKLLGEANAGLPRAKDARDDHGSQPTVKRPLHGHHAFVARGLFYGAAGGLVGTLVLAFIILAIIPYDSTVAVAVAEIAMGKSGQPEAAAARLHGGPLKGGKTLLSVYALMQLPENARRLQACFAAANTNLRFTSEQTTLCTIQIPAQFRQYQLLVEPATIARPPEAASAMATPKPAKPAPRPAVRK